ncbi:MAG: sulfotransferase family protein [Acidimicrobiia bacterium]
MTGSNSPFFVVGCPRSGTTLMRVMLDSHPRLAVPRETHFVVGLAIRSRRHPVTVEDIVSNPRFSELGLEPDVVRAAVARDQPSDYAQLVASVFRTYATSHRKPRWGDKTPGYLAYMPLLLEMYPDAQFVHMIRDGREVAASLSEQAWGPRTAIGGAYWWRRKVRDGRAAGRELPAGTYMEVRLDELIAEPETHLRRVCGFLDEDYFAEMLDYPERMRTPGMHHPVHGRHLERLPTADLRDWRAGRSELEQHAIETVCRSQLKELGYPTESRSLRALVYAWCVRSRDLLVQAPSAVRQRFSPATRAF